MVKEFNSGSKLNPKELAKHLRQPSGEVGKQVGIQMNKGNRYICQNSYKVLAPKNGDDILEIGMGNGYFVSELLAMANNLSYVGLDFSSTMIKEAKQINKQWIEKGNVIFKQATLEDIPYDDNSFDSITTTNTLYFWPDPAQNAKELLRVLKPKGKLVIGYRSKDFMDQLEVAKHDFQKYKIKDAEDLLKTAGFKSINTEIIEEPELSFDGKVFNMKGVYTVASK